VTRIRTSFILFGANSMLVYKLLLIFTEFRVKNNFTSSGGTDFFLASKESFQSIKKKFKISTHTTFPQKN
jgi:hypothetical protein